MVWKVGDIIVCKLSYDYLFMVNDSYRSITEGRSYKIVKVYKSYIDIICDTGRIDGFRYGGNGMIEKHFYTKGETRKLKLDGIKKRTENTM